MCKFAEPELEDGTVTRVQWYPPGFVVCKLPYLGKITFTDFDERYLAFIVPDTKFYDKSGQPMTLDDVMVRVRKGDEAAYLFRERIDKPAKPRRTKGLLIEMRITNATT